MKKYLLLALVATMMAASAPPAKASTGCCDQGYEIKSAVCGTCDQGYLTNMLAAGLGGVALMVGIAGARKKNLNFQA